ncbi:hypothetical protein NDU88_007669, partial [Pleurodeles waltl]
HPRARRGALHWRVWQGLGRCEPPAQILMALLIPPHQPVEPAYAQPLQQQMEQGEMQWQEWA